MKWSYSKLPTMSPSVTLKSWPLMSIGLHRSHPNSPKKLTAWRIEWGSHCTQTWCRKPVAIYWKPCIVPIASKPQTVDGLVARGQAVDNLLLYVFLYLLVLQLFVVCLLQLLQLLLFLQMSADQLTGSCSKQILLQPSLLLAEANGCLVNTHSGDPTQCGLRSSCPTHAGIHARHNRGPRDWQ